MSEQVDASGAPPPPLPPPRPDGSSPSAPSSASPSSPSASSRSASSPSGVPTAGSRQGVDDTISAWLERAPFDSVGEALEWWYRPVVERRTWVALGSLFVGAVWGPVMFAIVVTLAAVTFGLVFVGVGLLLIVPTFAVVNSLAVWECRRAGWTGTPVTPATPVASPGGTWGAIRTRLGDATRWRQVLYVGLFVVAGPLLFAAASAPWAFVVGRVAGFDAGAFDFGTFSFDLGGLLVAAVVAGLAPRITLGAARIGRSFTASLLGPNEATELQERVTELSGQRQQILDAVAEERRRIERNLHDGVQQQLVALGIDIGLARTRLDSDPDGAAELLDAARDKVRGSIGELRLIGRGLNPAVLDDRGLDAALSAVVAASPIPISVDITTEVKLDDDVAATAYYVANEAVANVLKHAAARVASIHLDDDPSGGVRLVVHDDGRGGADAAAGTGLAGMRARVEGVDGTFTIDSPPGGPTRLVAVLPRTVPRRT